MQKDMIIVHCSYTPPHMDIGAAEIRKWHMEDNGWIDIGYNLVIRRDGTLEPGRNIQAVGAHAKGFNARSIGICLIGGKGHNSNPDANFTVAQYTALKHAVRLLQLIYPIDDADVVGHRDLPGVTKTCPCFDVTNLLKD